MQKSGFLMMQLKWCRHYFNIFSMEGGINSYSTDKCTYVGTVLVGGPFSSQLMCLPVLIMNPVVRKPDFCLRENKGADQLRSKCEADQCLCFRYADNLQFLYILNPNFPVFSHLLCLHSSGCVRPGRKP